VLALLSQRPRCKSDWNVRLARGLAQEAALAISNARLYDAVEQNQRGLQARLRQLEHQAEALAHDLKGPSERIRELAGILQREYRHRFDPMALKWIVLLERNSREMVERVEAILAIARIGSKQMALIAVDPGLILDQVLSITLTSWNESRPSFKLLLASLWWHAIQNISGRSSTIFFRTRSNIRALENDLTSPSSLGPRTTAYALQ